MTKIITHRGLDPDKAPYYKESSVEAFSDQLERGYGLEFDVQFSKDSQMIIIHDSNLKRMTGGVDERKISEIDSSEILAMNFNGNHLTTLPHLFSLINDKANPSSLSALHVKHGSQTAEKLDAILLALEKADLNKLILFDVTIKSAEYIRKKNKSVRMAASVSHHHDISRYNSAVAGTLISIEELLENKNLFSWAWLDEWDLTDKDGGHKSLYNKEVFERLRKEGIGIALVTPELHGTSPGLLGGEAHPDASSRERLNERLSEIILLRPDAVCTDHPDYVADLIEKLQ